MARTSTTRPKGNGPGKGAGWGGPAKGASTSRIKPGDPAGIQAMSNDADVKARAAARNAQLKEHIYQLALGAEREETQLSAAVAWLDRDEGKPMQRQDVTSGGDKVTTFTIVTGVPRGDD